jgi:uncharacterized membrane protein
MAEKATIIAGLVIPSDSPMFLAIVGLHVLVALACVIAGVIAMAGNKGPGPHPRFGTLYYWCLAMVVASATVLSAMRWTEDYHLFLLGVLSFAAATVGRTAHRRRWRHWARLHITGMGASYILLLVAFYVDNGKNLPLWKALPPFTYWLIPTGLGVPLVLRALWRHPLAQHP